VFHSLYNHIALKFRKTLSVIMLLVAENFKLPSQTDQLNSPCIPETSAHSECMETDQYTCIGR